MHRTRIFVGLLILMAMAGSLSADSESVSVNGAAGKPGDWTPARLKSELASDITSVSYTSRGQKHTSNAVPLVALLKACGVSTQLKTDPKTDPKSKHPELRLVVIVQGSDGFAATFSLAELIGDLGNRPVWLAMDMDGTPLTTTEGPIKLIVPDDVKPARWVHQVQSISIIDVTQPATQPAK